MSNPETTPEQRQRALLDERLKGREPRNPDWRDEIGAPHLSEHDAPRTTLGCICCANGNDLSDGDVCLGCGRGIKAPITPPQPPPAGTLARAVWDARGGPPPVPKRAFA